MASENAREVLEQWAVDHGLSIERDSSGYYRDEDTQMAWSAVDTYAATLRQQAGRVDEVTDEMVDAAYARFYRPVPVDRTDPAWSDMRAALTAALAQNTPGEVVVTRDEAGSIVAVTRQDDEGRILSVIATAQNTQGAKPTAWLHTVTQDGSETDLALSFSADSFPLDTQLGFRSLGAVPLYLHGEGVRVPDGWKLVPIKLTLSMSVRGKWALCDHTISPEDFRRAWGEMLAAAPSQPKDADHE